MELEAQSVGELAIDYINVYTTPSLGGTFLGTEPARHYRRKIKQLGLNEKSDDQYELIKRRSWPPKHVRGTPGGAISTNNENGAEHVLTPAPFPIGLVPNIHERTCPETTGSSAIPTSAATHMTRPATNALHRSLTGLTMSTQPPEYS
ncbi:hypothetical protein JR316_0002830 [Psilocybe cubensis]|uniref:Uncharacterized protein n=1 Tax=Psilocybe cubensis TaxID=181762 RepID=A0ACB8HD38_PSICU|nr:hypothetical protein JR316_0002830 [Psilocybe cubensis]KAH9485913.1 hypothetical protein JR316_0002830 [Psilocybe cubensis]